MGVLPQPLSPLHWKIIVSDVYHVAEVTLRNTRKRMWIWPEMAAAYRPTADASDAVCGWFLDMRFILPAILPSFRFASCRSDDGQWRIEQQRGALWID